MNTMIDLTNFFSLTVLMHFVRMFVVFNVAHVTLKDKYNSFVTFISVIVTGLTCSCISLAISRPNLEIIYMLVIYTILALVLHLVTEGPFISKIFCSIIGIANTCLSNLCFAVFAKPILGEDVSVLFSYEVPLIYFLCMVLFNLAFSYIFIFIIVLLSKKKKNSSKYKLRHALFFIFPITHIFTAIPVAKTLLNSTNSDFLEFINIFFTFQCLLLDTILIFVIDYLDKVENEKVQKEREFLVNTMTLEQVEMFKEEKQEFRKIKHDFSNIIATAKGFIEIGKPEKALSILSDTDEHLMGLAGFSACANETLNTVLYIKLKQANKNGVELSSEIDEQNGILIDDYDLCRLLHNLLDNCINAAANSVDKLCKISIEITDALITATTENSYNSSKNSEQSDDKSSEHGNGIGIIKNIAKKYNGSLNVEKSNNIWITTVVLENRKFEK